MSNSIHQVLAFRAEGNIWKIHYDAVCQVLVLEIRMSEVFQTQFTAIQLPDCEVLWQDFHLAEPWWTGISAVQDGLIYFHFFPDSQKPQSREILAIDLFTRQPCWHSPEHQFYQLDNQGLIAGKWQENEWIYELLDKKNGQVLSSPYIHKTEENFEKKQPNFILPQHYRAETAYFKTIEQFFREGLQIEIKKSVDYLEIADYIIISYFLQKNEEFQNNLLILDTNAQILLHTIVNQYTEGIASESFLWINHQLFFIKDKSELMAFQL
ncbi:MAG: DUF4905 domain-containing protein [Microscillaceae bacterium]|nr:DUF4905 domain-containing protein [Microscillaceae bacterium]